MSKLLDNPFGIHPQALRLWQRRTGIIANNLANDDTPGFEARDIDFRSVMRQIAGEAEGALPLVTDQAHQIATSSFQDMDSAPLQYRMPMQPSVDGNTVETQIEEAVFAQNAVHYQASLTFITDRIQGLRMAISGDR